MPFWGPSSGMAAIIDLTSDNIDVPSSEIIDLTSADDPQPSHCASHGPDLKVEDESPTLVGSSTADSGESSPNTRRDDDTAPTESNPTDLGDLSPRNSQDEGNSSSDNDLGRIFARKKKRKNVSGDVPISEHKPIDTQLAPEALDPLVGSQPLKAGFDEFWSVRNCHVDDSSSTKTQQDGKQKAHQDKRVTIQQERQSTNNANQQILNIDRDEVLGPDKKKKKHSSKPSTQQESPKRPSRVDEQRPRAPAPRRAVSETPGTAHLKKETGNSGTVKLSQPLEEVETQRPHKRRKHSRRDDTISSSNSQAATLSITRSHVRPTDKPQDRGSETSSVERDCITGKDRATNIHHGGPSRYRPGGARTHREKRTTHIQRRQKKHLARAGEQAQKSERAGSSRQQEERAFMLASQNGRGQWERSGFQRAGMAFQRASKGTHDRRATSGRNWGHREARQQPHGVYSGKTGPRLSSESDTAHTEAAVQDEDIGEDQEIPEIRPQQSQQVQGNHDQQESRKIHPKANAAQSAARVEQPEKTMSPAARKKVMEKARQLFENHPSNPALRRKVEVANFIPPDVSKPSFSFRCQMVNASNGKRFGRKSRTATQKDEKRDRDRQRQILARRQKLEAQATQLFPNESEEHRETWIEDGMAQLRQRFTKNDQKREAQKSQGLLTVEDLEDAGAAGSDRIDRPAAAAPKGKRRGIPIAEALEPGATITLYVVYVSDPVDKGKELRNNDMKRLGDQFLRKEDANKHAEVVLRDERYDDSRLVSIQFRVGPEDGLFFGTKELADGRLVMCMVQRERQMASNLDLGDIFGRKELKETYCSRFDVFYTNIIPKVFVNKDEASTDQSKKGNSKQKSKSNTLTTDAAREPDPAEKEHADDDRDSLFSGSPTPEPEVAQSEKVEGEEVEDDDEGDESDADSVATDVTLAPSEPGGNLGSLSWNDVEYMHEHVCGFTTLELANQEAYKVALKLWRPRGNRMDPWLHYRNDIRPSLEELKTQELDVKAAELQFEVPEFEGHVDDRPWPFIHSTVFVKETRLEGPRDIGNYIVMGNDEDSGEDGEEDDEDD